MYTFLLQFDTKHGPPMQNRQALHFPTQSMNPYTSLIPKGSQLQVGDSFVSKLVHSSEAGRKGWLAASRPCSNH